MEGHHRHKKDIKEKDCPQIQIQMPQRQKVGWQEEKVREKLKNKLKVPFVIITESMVETDWWDDGLDVDALDAMMVHAEKPKVPIDLVVTHEYDKIHYRWALHNNYTNQLLDTLDERCDDPDAIVEVLLDPVWTLSWPVGCQFLIPKGYVVCRVSAL